MTVESEGHEEAGVLHLCLVVAFRFVEGDPVGIDVLCVGCYSETVGHTVVEQRPQVDVVRHFYVGEFDCGTQSGRLSRKAQRRGQKGFGDDWNCGT